MALGTVHSYANNQRHYKILIAAKYANVDVKLDTNVKLGVDNKKADFLAKFPFGKVPTMETQDGPLFDSTAIAYYTALSGSNACAGTSAYEKGCIFQYVMFFESEVLPATAQWIFPLMGYMPYNATEVQKAKDKVLCLLSTFEKILADKTFLVGEQITFADIVCATDLLWLYQHFFDQTIRSSFVNMTRWFETCINQPNFKSVIGDFAFCKTELTERVAAAKPAETAAPKAEAKADAKQAAAQMDEDDELVEKKKTFSLDLLPKSAFILDEWKRTFSNNPADVANEWFWKNFDAEGYSIWDVEYLYNEELAKGFMASNMVSGVFQRLDFFRKYAFGNMMLFGTDNDFKIRGMFLFRGSDICPEFIDNFADFEVFSFKKVDPSSADVRQTWNWFCSHEFPENCLNGKPMFSGRTFK